MEIPKTLLKYRFHILIFMVCSVIILFGVYVAPSFLEIVKYFWPLLVSTALFLFAVVVFGKISPPHVEVSGEGILEYVAAPPEELVHECIGEVAESSNKAD
ncbi:hypothetical protein LIER_38397 [Lithospermum erythrorhizon]|uniref:Uncharacterized protein n=1 Tax=Lithospermum erythrorhizon TaxID=34254 RepID=A0AAV3Q2B6_LITER